MEKIIQIATCGAENGHSLYALTEDGKVYERCSEWHSNATEVGTKEFWKEIPEEKITSTPRKGQIDF